MTTELPVSGVQVGADGQRDVKARTSKSSWHVVCDLFSWFGWKHEGAVRIFGDQTWRGRQVAMGVEETVVDLAVIRDELLRPE